MVRASFGTSTWPESTRVIRLPSITTVALSTGLPPFPSMSWPPRTTMGAFLAAMIIFPPLLLTICFSCIETIDKTALIQFSNEAHICEIFGLGIPCPRILFRKAIQDRLDAIQGRILLAREQIVGHGKIVSLLKNLPILQSAHVFRQNSNPGLTVGLEAVDSLHLRLDICPDDIGVLPSEPSSSRDSRMLIGKPKRGHVSQNIEALFLGHKSAREIGRAH